MIASGGFAESTSTFLNSFATPSQNQNGWVTLQGSIEFAGHCMSQLDSMYLVLTGGYRISSSGFFSQGTYFYNWYNFNGSSVTAGPDLILNRAEHGCSFVTGKDGNPTAIVAGGLVASGVQTNTVEFYNRATKKWESGPALPKPMSGFQVRFLKYNKVPCLFVATAFLAYLIFFPSEKHDL